MFLRSLYLHNFRLYSEVYYEFSPQINMICGANARGKTSVLEAIHFLVSGKSFRAWQTSDLIRRGASAFFLEAHFIKHGIDQRLKVVYSPKERRVIYNSTQFPSYSSLIGLMHGVVVCPDDTGLIKGPPLLRRQFLDLQIAQADPLYVHHLMRYSRAMHQRNYLLRAKKLQTIESWECEMSVSAAYITQQRLLALKGLSETASRFHRVLTNDPQDFKINYKPGIKGDVLRQDLKVLYAEMYRTSRKKEMELSYTIYGPHKDDIGFQIGNEDVRYFASEGQQRSCIAALRLAEWLQLKDKTELPPMMLIDDIGISLDEERRGKLFDQLSSLSQVFVTSTSDFPLISSDLEKKVFKL